jgi:hypothetical protein
LRQHRDRDEELTYFNAVTFFIFVTKQLGFENINAWHLSQLLAVTMTRAGKMKEIELRWEA